MTENNDSAIVAIHKAKIEAEALRKDSIAARNILARPASEPEYADDEAITVQA